jgi:hypothetical protein
MYRRIGVPAMTSLIATCISSQIRVLGSNAPVPFRILGRNSPVFFAACVEKLSSEKDWHLVAEAMAS